MGIFTFKAAGRSKEAMQCSSKQKYEKAAEAKSAQADSAAGMAGGRTMFC